MGGALREHAISCPVWGGFPAPGCTCAPPAIHRENIPPIDLGPVEARIIERRVYARSPVLHEATRLALESDTDMMQELVTEVKRVRLANTSLRAALGPGRAMPVAK